MGTHVARSLDLVSCRTVARAGTAALLVILGSSLAAPQVSAAPRAGQTFTVTEASMCGGAGTFEQAIKDANATPGQDTVAFAAGLSVDASPCYAPQYAAGRPYPITVTESVDIIGAGTVFDGHQGWLDQSGKLNNPLLCAGSIGTAAQWVTLSSGLLRVGDFGKDNAGIVATITGLTFRNMPSLVKVESNAFLSMVDVTASEIIDTNESCRRPLIDADRGASVDLERVQIDHSSLPGADRSESSVDALIRGFGGNLVLDRVFLAANITGRAVYWEGGNVDIVSTRIVQSGGLLLNGDANAMVNSAYFADGQNPTDRVESWKQSVSIEGSSLYWAAPECRGCVSPPSAMGLLARSPGSFALAGTALGATTTGYPRATLLAGDLARFSSDAYTWVEPTVRQDAAALQVIVPSALTAAPGLTEFGLGAFWTDVLTPLLGDDTAPGVLVDAIPDAFGSSAPAGANALVNPVDGSPILTDVLGNPRWDGNGARDIGAIQLTLAPHLSVVTAGDSSVSLAWTRPVDPASGAITGYRIGYRLAGSGDPITSTVVQGAGTTSGDVTGLRNGAAYEFVVAAANPSVGPVSNTVVATPAGSIGTPRPAASPGRGEATITWPAVPTGGQPLSYAVTYSQRGSSTGPSAVPVTTGTQVVLTGLTGGVTYDVCIVAFDSANPATQGAAGCVAVTPTNPLASPTLSAIGGDGYVDLAWNAFDDTVMPQTLTYRPNQVGATPQAIALPPCAKSPCSARVNGLVNGATYVFQVAGAGPVPVQTTQATAIPAGPVISLWVAYANPVGGHVGEPLALRPTLSGGPAKFEVSSGSLPPGLDLDPATGVITGIPSREGVALVNIKATAMRDSMVTPITFRIDGHNVAISYADVTGTVGTALSVAPGTSGLAGPPTYALKGSLPAGLSFDRATGVISGTPTAATAGAISLSATVQDDYGTSAPADFTVTISAGQARLAASYPSASGQVGEAISVSPGLNGASGALTFTLTGGSLPPGLALNATTGVVSGTPTAMGTSTAQVTVRDSNGSAVAPVTITVVAHRLAVAYPNGEAEVGQFLELVPTVSAAIGRVSFSITSGTLPAGMSLDAVTGRIVGIPTAVTASPSTLTVRANDAYGTSTASASITVTSRPVAVQVNARAGRDGEAVIATGVVSGLPGGTPVTPMIKVSGQSTFIPGPVQLTGPDGFFLWARALTPGKALTVYFEVAGATSARIAVAPATITITGARRDGRVAVQGEAVNVAVGDTVTPRYSIDDGPWKLGTVVPVAQDGAFTWSRSLRNGKSIRITFVDLGTRSNQLSL